jgi:flotillin
MNAKIEETELKLENDGWRQGRPVEDPDKTKRWGFVSAKPSEYLVHVRRGKIRSRSSGQGATCFKWPWDAVSIVPTSVQRLSFSADQVTSEKVGVQVVGLAVYRIAEPLIAYRVLNFSYPERAQQKLEQTLSAMFVGATRRLAANLTVEECLQKRKSALAEELLREIAPVVGGEGRPEDGTDRGWGIVIDTIEIQEVTVLSEKLFMAMQAPYRALLDQKAREARADAEKQIATREAECRREVEAARLRAERAIKEQRAEAERLEAEARIRDELALRERRLEAERVQADAEALAAIHRHELEKQQAQAELDAHALKTQLLASRAELEASSLRSDLERRRALADVGLLEGQKQADVALALARADRESAEAHARRVTADKLPELASAIGQRIGEVRVTQLGLDGNAFGSITQAIKSVVELARQA